MTVPSGAVIVSGGLDEAGLAKQYHLAFGPRPALDWRDTTCIATVAPVTLLPATTLSPYPRFENHAQCVPRACCRWFSRALAHITLIGALPIHHGITTRRHEATPVVWA